MAKFSAMNTTTNDVHDHDIIREKKKYYDKEGAFVLTIEMNDKWFLHLFLLKTNVLNAFLLIVQD